jgi:lambda family phage minor tail protein L
VTEFELPSDGRLPRPKIKMASPSGMLSAVVAVNHDFHGCKVTRKRTFAKFLDDVNFFNRGNPFGQSDFEAHLPDDVYYIHRKTFDSKEGIEFELASILEISDIKFPGRQIMEDYCPFRYRDESCGYKGVPVCGVEDSPLSAYGIYKLTYIDSSAQRLALAQDKNGVIPEISEWNAGFLYQKGDVVYLHGDKPPVSRSYFVCIKESSSEYLRSTYPATSQEHWVLDSCSKKLTGCLKRFGSKCANKLPLPFGGFPSVQGLKYD